MEIATTGSLEVKLLTRTGAATVVGAVREEIQSEERRLKWPKRLKKIAMHCVFLMFSGSGGSKRWLAKAVGAEPSGEMRNEKLHAVAARNTCGSQNVRT